MTVRAHDLALCNLSEHVLPTPIPQPLADVEELVPNVVELEDERVGFSAVNAWMSTQELDDVPESFREQRALPGARVVDVSLPVCRVVRMAVVRAARPAIAIPLPALLASTSEIIDRPQGAAAAASSVLVR